MPWVLGLSPGIGWVHGAAFLPFLFPYSLLRDQISQWPLPSYAIFMRPGHHSPRGNINAFARHRNKMGAKNPPDPHSGCHTVDVLGYGVSYPPHSINHPKPHSFPPLLTSRFFTSRRVPCSRPHEHVCSSALQLFTSSLLRHGTRDTGHGTRDIVPFPSHPLSKLLPLRGINHPHPGQLPQHLHLLLHVLRRIRHQLLKPMQRRPNFSPVLP